MIKGLQERVINGGQITGSDTDGFRLKLPVIKEKKYALAQLDDYMHLRRRDFLHQSPVSLSVEACISNPDVPGTWGFGFWNDPFSFGFGAGGMSRWLPVLPNAAWFFYASEHNHLSLRDDQPGSGFHVKTFSAPLWHPLTSLLGLPFTPFLLFPGIARVFRRLGRQIVAEDTQAVDISITDWHQYDIRWRDAEVAFLVDEQVIFKTGIVPRGRQGLVIWIDNQYFRFDPAGRIGFGFLPTQSEYYLDIRNLFLLS